MKSEQEHMSGKYAKNGVRSDVSGEIGANELDLDFLLERQKNWLPN